MIEALKGHPLFAHVTLTRSERSPIAALVTEMLEDLPGLTSLCVAERALRSVAAPHAVRSDPACDVR